MRAISEVNPLKYDRTAIDIKTLHQ